MYCQILEGMGIDPEDVDTESHPITAVKILVMMRCDPKCEVYEGLIASSTGGVIKSAVVRFWKFMVARLRMRNIQMVRSPAILKLHLKFKS